jgi:potassium efflux system protein
VGIAYGSDTDRAVEVLRKVAEDSVMVLHDPQPQVYFLEFGDSSLNFELRVFTRGVDRRFRARHQLHMAIDKAFREAGIEIAFPQRDLHVRSIPVEWRRPPAEKS